MKRIVIGFVCFLLVLNVAHRLFGGSSSAPEKPVIAASCKHKIGACQDYSQEAVSNVGEKSLQDLCKMGYGTWSKTACPAATVGTCATPGGAFSEYYTGSVADAKKECEDGPGVTGKFTPAK